MSSSQVRQAVENAFRDYKTAGVPASGAHEPIKAEIREALGKLLETTLNAISAGIKRFATLTAMNASAGNAAGDLAYVYANGGGASDPANGYYQYTGTAWVSATWLDNLAVEAVGSPDGNDNYFVGGAGDGSVAGVSNTGIGSGAVRDTSTGSNNTGVGVAALRANTAGSGNTAVGSAAERVNGTGIRNVTVGAEAGLGRTGGDGNVTVGFGAMAGVVAGGDNNTAVGIGALAVYPGDESVAVGANALGQATGSFNVALGSSAGGGVTTGRRNLFLGSGAGGVGQAPDAENTIVLGNGAKSTQSNDIVLGTAEHGRVMIFDTPMIRYSIARESLYFGPAAAGGGIGDENGANVGVGAYALHRSTLTGTTVAVGRNAGYWARKLSGCVAIGADAMKNGNNESPGVLPPGTVLGDPTDCTAVGCEAGRDWQGIVGAVAVGRISQAKTTTGTGNTSVGDASLRDNTVGEGNVAVGYGAVCFNIDGDRNVGLGQASLYRGLHINRNVGAGQECLEFNEGNDNVAVGDVAGRALTGGNKNVFIGAAAGIGGAQKVDAQNSIAIGYGAVTGKDNQVVLGADTVTETVLRGVTKHTVTTVAGLPSAVAAGVGVRAFVSDATASAFGTVVVGGGAVKVPVYSDGAAWRIG